MPNWGKIESVKSNSIKKSEKNIKTLVKKRLRCFLGQNPFGA